MTRRRPLRRAVGSLDLWAPPALTDPLEFVVSTDPGSRFIVVPADTDATIVMPADPVEFDPASPYNVSGDAIVTVSGGRNVIINNPRIRATYNPAAYLSTGIDADTLTIPVVSTAGFPEAGWLRIDGEGIAYSSKTATQFNATERRFGFYNGQDTLPDTPHASGAKVYIGEYARSALSVRGQSGSVYVRGARFDGEHLIDGIRARGSVATTVVTMVDTRIGPVGPTEQATMQDGHADCVQLWGSGVRVFRMNRATLLCGVNGRAFLNGAATPVEEIDLRDVEMVDTTGRRVQVVTNETTETIWNLANTWIRTPRARASAINDADLAAMFQAGEVVTRDPDLVP